MVRWTPALLIGAIILTGCGSQSMQQPPYLSTTPVVLAEDPQVPKPHPVPPAEVKPLPEPQPEPQPQPVLDAPPPAPAQEPPPRPTGAAADSAPAVPVPYALGDGRRLLVDPAEGSMPSVRRAVRLQRQANGQWSTLQSISLPALIGNTVTFARQDLPGHPGAIVLEARRDHGVRHGAVAVEGDTLLALDYYRLVAPQPEVTHGVFVYLNKYLNEVWVYRDGELEAMFPTANGRDPWFTEPITWANTRRHFGTPEGLFPVAKKLVNPAYNNFSGLNHAYAGGDPDNPLGTRWIGLNVLNGDGGGIYAFHGTAVPYQLGTWASEGCIRLYTSDAERLYDMVSEGTLVRIVRGR